MQLSEHLAVLNERCILALRFYLLYICDVGVHVAEINVLIVLSIIVCVCCTEMRLRCVTALVVACLLATAAAQDQAGKSGLRSTDLLFPVWFPAFVLPQRPNYSRDANRALHGLRSRPASTGRSQSSARRSPATSRPCSTTSPGMFVLSVQKLFLREQLSDFSFRMNWDRLLCPQGCPRLSVAV